MKINKKNALLLWEEYFGNREYAEDFHGNLMCRDGLKDLKRNITTTISSSLAVSVSILIASVFLIYDISMLVGMPALFSANESYSIDISRILKIINILAFVILPVISVLIVSNSIKVILHSRKQEIKTMKLIGATDKMISLPFMFEGIFIGMIGGAIGAFIVGLLYKCIFNVAVEFLPKLELLAEVIDMKIIFLVFMVYGIIISIVGSIISLRIHLKNLS